MVQYDCCCGYCWIAVRCSIRVDTESCAGNEATESGMSGSAKHSVKAKLIIEASHKINNSAASHPDAKQFTKWYTSSSMFR